MRNNRIVCAAIRFEDSEVIAGTRHYDRVMRDLCKSLQPLKTYNMFTTGEQGFLDRSGNFHSRQDAWVIAKDAEQIRWHKSIKVGELFSEDLY